MLPGNSSLRGQQESPPSSLRLRAGPLVMLFEPGSGFVRRICLEGHEVLRGIYVAVRDRNWGTVPACVESLKQDVHENRFELNFAVNCRAGDIHFRWNGHLSGDLNGTLRYIFEGEALTTFLKNRIGFSVLHPLRECCAAPAWYELADGRRGEVRFPTLIEPQIIGRSAFHDLHRLAHEIRPGCWAEVEFEGDLFETEDQRNWTDASFKTYCTPLALPFPVEMKAGARLRQAITLRLGGREKSKPLQAEPRGVVSVKKEEQVSGTALVIPREPSAILPRLGVAIAAHGVPLSPEEITRLSVLELSHLRVDVRLTDLGWPQVLTRAITEVHQLGGALELAVHLGADGSESSLAECAAMLRRAGVPMIRVMAFRQSEPASSLATLQLARKVLRLGEVPIGGGSDAHFCELNREQALGRFGLNEADFVSWAMTPQVHAFDDLSVIENLEAQPHTVATARAFAGTKPLVVSPITLRPRFNAVATGEEISDTTQLPPEVDPRQPSLFNAAWTLGSIAAMASTNVASLTYFETTGWRGLMESTAASLRHPLFPAIPGMVFPVYSVFAAIAGFTQWAPVSPSDLYRDTLASLCLFDAQGKRRLLCANLTNSELPLALDLGVGRPRLRTLVTTGGGCSTDETRLAWAQGAEQDCPSGILRLTLPAYDIACLDSA